MPNQDIAFPMELSEMPYLQETLQNVRRSASPPQDLVAKHSLINMAPQAPITVSFLTGISGTSKLGQTLTEIWTGMCLRELGTLESVGTRMKHMAMETAS